MKYLCIHGHFYQPPRENPWLETIKREPSASPFHDWNERIHMECYSPNTFARVFDQDGLIEEVLNNYEWMSFNFGPTLLRWMESHYPDAIEQLRLADQKSLKRCGGHGNAIAQSYNHLIMPLATRRDKETQILWGIADFERLYGRKPEGMWLSETAIDLETLDLLAKQNIRYVILSPRQAWKCKAPNESHWHDVDEHSLDSRRAYLCRLSNDRDIGVFFYDGELANAVAFGGILHSGPEFYERLKQGLDSSPENSLTHLATDGETYGHHLRGGESALAYAFAKLRDDEGIQITNYADYLEKHPPTWEVQIHEDTSWSCFHGIDRWRSNCACHTGNEHWQRSWREGLRVALDALKRKLDILFEERAKLFFVDPWGVRDRAISLLFPNDFGKERSNDASRSFLKQELKAKLPIPFSETEPLMLLEMERQSMLMFTSCGWFFDDISGIETIQILAHARRAIELAAHFGLSFAAEFRSLLEKAPSNLPIWKDGAKIWDEVVEPLLIERQTILSNAAIMYSLGIRDEFPLQKGMQCLEKKELEAKHFSFYQYEFLFQGVYEAKKEGASITTGFFESIDAVTLASKRAAFCFLHFGSVDFHCWLKQDLDLSEATKIIGKVKRIFEIYPLGGIHKHLRLLFRHTAYGLEDLLPAVLEKLLEVQVGSSLSSFEKILIEKAEAERDLWNPLFEVGWKAPDLLKKAFACAQLNWIESWISSLEESLWEAPSFLPQKTVFAEDDKKKLSQLLDDALYGFFQRDMFFVNEVKALLDLYESFDLSNRSWLVQKAFLDFLKRMALKDSEDQASLLEVAEMLGFSIDRLKKEYF